MAILEIQNYNKWLNNPYNIWKLTIISTVDIKLQSNHIQVLKINDLNNIKQIINTVNDEYIAIIDKKIEFTENIIKCYSKCIELLEKNKNTNMSEFVIEGFLNTLENKINKDFTIGINDRESSKNPYWLVNKVWRASFLKSINIYNDLSKSRNLHIQSYLKSSRINFVNLIGLKCEYEKIDINNILQFNFNRDALFDSKLEQSRNFVKNYEKEIEENKSLSLKKIFDISKKEAEDLWIMSLGSNCAIIYSIADYLRVRGPLDNLHSKRGLSTIDNVFENNLENSFFNSSYTRKKLNKEVKDNDLLTGTHFCEYETEFKDYRMNHNDFEEDSVQIELHKRIDNLYSYINLCEKYDTLFLVYSFGLYDYKDIKNRIFNLENFNKGLDILRKNNLLNKTLFISTKSPLGGYWNFDVKQYLKNFNYIEVEIYSGNKPEMSSEKRREFNNIAKSKVLEKLKTLKKEI